MAWPCALRRKRPPAAACGAGTRPALHRRGALKLAARFVYNPRLVARQAPEPVSGGSDMHAVHQSRQSLAGMIRQTGATVQAIQTGRAAIVAYRPVHSTGVRA